MTTALNGINNAIGSLEDALVSGGSIANGLLQIVASIDRSIVSNAAVVDEVDDIQPAIDAQTNISLAKGDYSVSATLDIPNKIGGIIRGSGRGEVLPIGNPYRGSQTNLIATSPLGADPMMEIQGSDWSVEELGIWGAGYYGTKYYNVATHTGATSNTVLTAVDTEDWATDQFAHFTLFNVTDGSMGTVQSNTAGTVTVDELTGGISNDFVSGDVCNFKPPLGVLIKKGASVGTGKIHFRNCYFGWLDIGVKFGDAISGANCDLCHFENPRYKNVEICNLSLHSFAVVSRWTNVTTAGGVGTFLKVIGGGKYVIDGINVNGANTKILHIANDENNDIGSGNNQYTIRDMYIDAQGDDTLVVDMTPDSTATPYDPVININCIGGHISNATYTGPAWNIYQNTLLTIRDYSYIQNDMIRWQQNAGVASKDSTVIVDGCRLTGGVAADLFDVAGSTGVCNAVVINCVDTDGGLIANYSAELTGAG